MPDDCGISQKEYRNKFHELKRVASQNADMHSWEAARYGRWNQFLVSGGLVFSVFLLTLVLASEDFVHRTINLMPDLYKWVLAILASFNFSLTLILMAWQPAQKAAQHKEAVTHYARAKHRIDLILRGEELITKEAAESFLDEYLDKSDLPQIPNALFIKLKKRHLVKVAISKQLSSNPHRSIREIKQDLAKSYKTTKLQGQTGEE